MTVLEMTSALLDAAHDPRIKGLVIAFNESMIEHRAILTGEVIESNLGMGVLNELRQALSIFRQAKLVQRLAEKGGDDSLAPDESDTSSNKTIFVSPPESASALAEKGIQSYSPDQDVIIAIADKYSIILCGFIELIVVTGFQYSLAATASKIFMQDSGTIQLTGMSIQQLVGIRWKSDS